MNTRLTRTWGARKKWFPISIPGRSAQARWDGYASDNALSDWLKGGWYYCDLQVAAFTEGPECTVFTLPAGKIIAALTKIIVEDNKYVRLFRVITRSSRGSEIGLCKRWPVVRKAKYRR